MVSRYHRLEHIIISQETQSRLSQTNSSWVLEMRYYLTYKIMFLWISYERVDFYSDFYCYKQCVCIYYHPSKHKPSNLKSPKEYEKPCVNHAYNNKIKQFTTI